MKYILIKAGFRSKSAAALFGINWHLSNNYPIAFKEEDFVLFKLYNVYYVICGEQISPGGISPQVRKIGNP